MKREKAELETFCRRHRTALDRAAPMLGLIDNDARADRDGDREANPWYNVQDPTTMNIHQRLQLQARDNKSCDQIVEDASKYLKQRR